jgi:hypothetical protein
MQSIRGAAPGTRSQRGALPASHDVVKMAVRALCTRLNQLTALCGRGAAVVIVVHVVLYLWVLSKAVSTIRLKLTHAHRWKFCHQIRALSYAFKIGIKGQASV